MGKATRMKKKPGVAVLPHVVLTKAIAHRLTEDGQPSS
jgi:hypothetical protein